MCPRPAHHFLGLVRRPLTLALCLAALGAAAPLATAAGSDPSLPLASGQLGAYSWTLRALGSAAQMSGGDRAGGGGACLSLAAVWHRGRFSLLRSRVRSCLADPSPGGEPAVAMAVQPAGGAPVRMTAIAVLAPPAAHQLALTFANGARATLATRPLAAAGPRYAVLVRRGWWCLRSLRSESAAGAALWSTPTEPDFTCSADGSGLGAPIFTPRAPGAE